MSFVGSRFWVAIAIAATSGASLVACAPEASSKLGGFEDEKKGDESKKKTTAGSSPKVDALDPASAAAGGNGVSVRVRGSGFVSSSKVNIDGQVIPGKFENDTSILIDLASDKIARPGNVRISIENPSNAKSNTVTFAVSGQPTTSSVPTTPTNPTNPTPQAPQPPTITISSLSPNTIDAESPGFALTAVGNFAACTSAKPCRIQFNGTPLPTTQNGQTQLATQVSAPLVVLPGTFNVTVEQAGQIAVPVLFTVKPKAVTTVQNKPDGGAPPNAAAIPCDRYGTVTGGCAEISGTLMYCDTRNVLVNDTTGGLCSCAAGEIGKCTGVDRRCEKRANVATGRIDTDRLCASAGVDHNCERYGKEGCLGLGVRCLKTNGKLDYQNDSNCVAQGQEGVTGVDQVGSPCDIGGECLSVNRRCGAQTKRVVNDPACTAESVRLCSSVTKSLCVASNKRCNQDAQGNYTIGADTACFGADDDRRATGDCNAPKQCIARGVRCNYYSAREADETCLGPGQERTAQGEGTRYEGGILCEASESGRCENGKYCDGTLWKADAVKCPNNRSSLPATTTGECPESRRDKCVGDKKCKDSNGTLKLLPDQACATACGGMPALQCSTESVCVGNKYCSGGCLVEGTQWGCGINKPNCREGVCNDNLEICRNGEYVPTEFGCAGACSPQGTCHKKYNFRCDATAWVQDDDCTNGVDKQTTSSSTASQNASVCQEDSCDGGTTSDPGPRVCSDNKWIPATLSNSTCSDEEAGYCSYGRCHPTQAFRCGNTGFYWDTDSSCVGGRDTAAGGTECTGTKCIEPGYICNNGYREEETECYAAGKNYGETEDAASSSSSCEPICTGPGTLKNANCQLVSESTCCLEGFAPGEACD